MRIKIKGGPCDGRFVSVNQPEPEMTITVSELLNGEHLIVSYRYRLEKYITTRFGGRQFYRYVYQERGIVLKLFASPAVEESST